MITRIISTVTDVGSRGKGKKIISLVLLALFLFTYKNYLAQTDSTDIYNLSLAQLSKLKITSAIKVTQKAENKSVLPVFSLEKFLNCQVWTPGKIFQIT